MNILRPALLAAAFAGASLPALAAHTPKPIPTPKLPTKPLHARLQVEVNDRGQVVAVVHGTLTGDKAVDTMLVGNALQSFIRTSDGRSVPGLFWLRYDYNPRTKKVVRTPSLIKAESTWAHDPGAVTVMVGELKRQAQLVRARIAEEEHKRQAEEAKHLPDIDAAIRRSRAQATPKPAGTH